MKLIKKYFTVNLLLAIAACQFEKPAENPYTYEKANKDYFDQFIAQSKGQKAISLVNHSYPIELTLKNDNSFYYLLENLGDGYGKWKYSDNYLYLYAERDMFVMKFYMHKAEGLSNPIIEFADRFGPKYLELEEK